MIPEFRGRILIIDDDPDVLSSIGDYFTKLEYEVHRAETGAEGIVQWNRVRPGVTILDLHLPDIDGLEVLETLRQKRAVVLMLTGYGEIDDAVQAMRLGAESFLSKPTDMHHLAVAVERAFEKAQLHTEVRRLRAITAPGLKQRLRQWAGLVGLVTISALGGMWIGSQGTKQAIERAPIPLRIAPEDTASEDPSREAQEERQSR